jgi:hypothetical protein
MIRGFLKPIFLNSSAAEEKEKDKETKKERERRIHILQL